VTPRYSALPVLARASFPSAAGPAGSTADNQGGQVAAELVLELLDRAQQADEHRAVDYRQRAHALGVGYGSAAGRDAGQMLS
jgi:hypothetical protein